MWLLADLHHDLPEVGDLDRPKLVFFFDEAHLLFRDASKDFLDQIAQTVRLIRSKGVGVFFVTQVPTDVPPEVLAQLGNRVQHALRVFTPQDAKSLSSTVSTLPALAGLRARRTAAVAGNRRGRRHGALRDGRSDPGRVDPAAAADIADGAAGSGRADQAGAGVAHRAEVRRRCSTASRPTRSCWRSQPPRPRRSQDKRPPPARRRTSMSPRREKATMTTTRLGPRRQGVGAVLGSSAFKAFTRNVGSSLGREITRSLFGTARRRR